MAEGYEYITNADDVVLNIGGTKAGPNSKVVVASFEFNESNDVNMRSGVGQHNPVGPSFGDAEYEFSFTAEGEPDLKGKLALNPDGTPPMVSIKGYGEKDDWVIPHAWPDDKTFSGDSGDPTEYDATLQCMPPKRL